MAITLIFNHRNFKEKTYADGFGAELSAKISSEGFECLDAPIKRVASVDAPIAYSSSLEDVLLVQTDWIEKEIINLVNY